MATDNRDRAHGPANGTRDPDGDRYDAHLERSRIVWDRWSDYYTMSENDLEPMREAAIDRLDLEPGDRVLEIGCGPGVNFDRVRSEIGEHGELIAVDYSPDMVAKARERIEHHGWENVDVRRADATTVEFDEPFDAAIATLSLSVMPNIHRTATTVHRSLVADATFVVVDIRPIPDGPGRVLNPLLWRFLRWYANWNPDDDVVDALATVFDTHEIVDTSLAGTLYTVVCEKGD
ncbi:methyltransferase domain-containing protein [Natronolimnohabitans sp. A-GB9]|uniref:class I SAM-dependent methyltransferase n=1 Tax=Natronolimnohabitans sp. A-GB9 TaxID=3069757 RepID=UPI0027B7AF32|nr:methyltransferase domain-containing protein [Natronolimnohabitans sp. A-GB9]MDQ2049428.1 methyltransferase domain-containing protein [Natronolimnohabitans sp. A-GB9]